VFCCLGPCSFLRFFSEERIAAGCVRWPATRRFVPSSCSAVQAEREIGSNRDQRAAVREKSPTVKKSLLKCMTSISLALTGLFTLSTGIWNFFPPFIDSFSPGHAIDACIFCALGLFHVWLNWKPMLKYFKGLGWWWFLIGLSVISIVMVTGIPVVWAIVNS